MTPDGDGKNYGELGISVTNVNYDFIIINPDTNNWQSNAVWDIDELQSTVSVDGTPNNKNDEDRSWVVEIRIPFKSLLGYKIGVKLPIVIGDTWRLNLYRIDHDHKTEEWKPNGKYSWSETGDAGFHVPSRFGKITLSIYLL